MLFNRRVGPRPEFEAVYMKIEIVNFVQYSMTTGHFYPNVGMYDCYEWLSFSASLVTTIRVMLGFPVRNFPSPATGRRAQSSTPFNHTCQ